MVGILEGPVKVDGSRVYGVLNLLFLKVKALHNLSEAQLAPYKSELSVSLSYFTQSGGN